MTDQALPMSREALAALETTTVHGPITHLPVWQEIRADRVEAGLRQLLADTEAAFNRLEQGCTPTWAGLRDPLELLKDLLGRVTGTIVHISSVKYSDELQAAYDAIRPAYVALVTRIGQSRPVYEAMVALRDGPGFAGLSD